MAPFVAIAIVVVGGALWSFLAHAVPQSLRSAAGAVFLAAMGFGAGHWTPAPRRDSAHKRGAYLDDTPARSGTRDQSRIGGSLTLAGILVLALDETRHFKLIGTTGTGKSTAIRELLDGALKRGDRAVIADPDGGYLMHSYDPARGDVILNPFDPRSRKWDLLGEIRNPYDFEQLTRSLIPDGAGDHQTWNRYGQTLLSAVMRQAQALNTRDTTELYRLLTSTAVEKLRLLVEGTAAQAFVAAGNERMWGSIRSVTAAAVAALDFINRQRSELLSIRSGSRRAKGCCFCRTRRIRLRRCAR